VLSANASFNWTFLCSLLLVPLLQSLNSIFFFLRFPVFISGLESIAPSSYLFRFCHPACTPLFSLQQSPPIRNRLIPSRFRQCLLAFFPFLGPHLCFFVIFVRPSSSHRSPLCNTPFRRGYADKYSCPQTPPVFLDLIGVFSLFSFFLPSFSPPLFFPFSPRLLGPRFFLVGSRCAHPRNNINFLPFLPLLLTTSHVATPPGPFQFFFCRFLHPCLPPSLIDDCP